MRSNEEFQKLIETSTEVTLDKMLEARERRVATQAKLLENCNTLVCFTMNIAGPYKYSPLIKKSADEGEKKLKDAFSLNGITYGETIVNDTYIGVERYIPLQDDPYKVKKISSQIEENFPLGRLFDIDVLKKNGEKVSRTDIDLEERGCIVCKRPGAACARSRRHTVEELQRTAIEIMCDYFNNKIADIIADKAVQALLYEVSITPKPGLVDRNNNGSHKDMNFYSFVDSAVAIRPYFKKCALVSAENSFMPDEKVFAILRQEGLAAEKEMFRATNGVNTHKGAIFTFGLVIYAVAHYLDKGVKFSLEGILKIVKAKAIPSLEDFNGKYGDLSYGLRPSKDYGPLGARGQAAKGFPEMKTTVPLLDKMLKNGTDKNEAGVRILLYLMSIIKDTNVIKRGGEESLLYVQKKAGELLEKDNIIEEAEAFDRDLIEKNISPGGCADLLALTFFLQDICKDI